MSETAKVRHLVQQYCKGKGIDVGCGGDKVVPTAIGVDLPQPYTNVGNDEIEVRCDIEKEYLPFKDESLDYVYSSHLIEDFEETETILYKLIKPLKEGGYLILVFPNQLVYEKAYGGFNEHHKHRDMGLSFIDERLMRIVNRFDFDLGFRTLFTSNCEIDYNVVMVLQKL